MLLNILVYLLTLLIYLLFDDNFLRFILTTCAYIIGTLIYKINCYKGILYLFIACICVLTESIFINFFSNTWEYKKSDIIGIPFWLIPLWGIAILLVLNINKDVENIITYLKKFL